MRVYDARLKKLKFVLFHQEIKDADDDHIEDSVVIESSGPIRSLLLTFRGQLIMDQLNPLRKRKCVIEFGCSYLDRKVCDSTEGYRFRDAEERNTIGLSSDQKYALIEIQNPLYIIGDNYFLIKIDSSSLTIMSQFERTDIEDRLILGYTIPWEEKASHYLSHCIGQHLLFLKEPWEGREWEMCGVDIRGVIDYNLRTGELRYINFKTRKAVYSSLD